MVVLDKRFSNRWQGRVSYVWSQTRGYLEQQRLEHLRQPTRSGRRRPTSSSTATASRVYDRPHELKVFATWQIPKIEVGLNGYYRYLSGTTYTPYQRFTHAGTSTTRRRAGASRSSSLAATAGSTAESLLDLRVEKIFPLGQGTDRLSVYADVQNVFNSGTVDRP